MNDRFRRFAGRTAQLAGSPWAFLAAASLVIGWLLSGPLFGFSESWQLFINTSTTVTTFLMVFVIQNSQNRDTKAINLKINELLRAVQEARTGLVQLDKVSDKTLEAVQAQFDALAKEGTDE